MFTIIGGVDVYRDIFNLLGISYLSTQFEHSYWNGVTFWDAIFAMFIFIMGAVIPFSFSRRLEAGKKSLFIHILKRTFALIFLGLIVNGLLNLKFSELRYMSVLGRIGICYLFSSIIYLHIGMKKQVIVLISILVGYWAIMTMTPGFDLTPSGNLAGYIDRMFLPGVFAGKYGDAEGILSTAPAIGTSLIGLLAGEVLKSNSLSNNNKSLAILISGACSLLLGLVWDAIFPINKLLWTSSYVLFTGGLSLILLSIFYYLIDIKGFKSWSFPFIVFGMNSILIYMLVALNVFNFITNIYLQIILKFLFLYYLYRNKILIKI